MWLIMGLWSSGERQVRVIYSDKYFVFSLSNFFVVKVAVRPHKYMVYFR